MLIMLVGIQMVVGEYSKIPEVVLLMTPTMLFSAPESAPIRQSELDVSKIMTGK